MLRYEGNWMENNTENTVISSQINNVSSSTVYVSFLSKKGTRGAVEEEHKFA